MINFALLTLTYGKVRARGYYIIVNRAENVINIVRSLSVVNLKIYDTMNCRYLS